MTRINKGFFSLCISLLTLLFIFNGCEDPGSVGSSYVDRPTLTFDTLSISQTDFLSYKGYSGRLGFIPMGHYSDPIFGEIDVKGFLKPSRSPAIPDSVQLQENFEMKLNVALDSLESYGDTLAQTNFSVYEITSNWRSNALRIDDNIQYGDLIGSFTVSDQRNIVVDLNQQWVDKYKTFFYNSNEIADIDSSYNYNFGGLAIVSDQQNSKVSFSRSDGTRFLFINNAATDTTDTVSVPMQDWGFTLDRTGAAIPNNTYPIHTTLEGMIGVTMPDSLLRADNNSKNIIRADLVFYEAGQDLETNLPPNSIRLPVTSLNMHLKELIEPAYEYQFGNIEFLGTPTGDDNRAFQINITNYVNDVIFGNESRRELILGAGSPSGALRSTLLYNENAAENVRPKIIITSLVD
jgi:hypothetical protein